MNSNRLRSGAFLGLTALSAGLAAGPEPRPHIQIRGIYGGVPVQIFERGKSLSDYGVDSVWIGSGGVTAERITLLKDQGARVFAEFNTLHEAGYLKDHPDAAPVGTDGAVSPPPDGWQGICPTHESYRRYRMEAFRALVERFDVDGVWLDYHHGHASWEQAVPKLPETCFCRRCLTAFARDTGVSLPDRRTAELAALVLGRHRGPWIRWRCGVFTDWVREFRAILDRARPGALLGTFHCHWSDEDFGGARIAALAIDLRAQARYVDVFSPMPYHARFGHASDTAWISRQVEWLGRHLGVTGAPGERLRIWPIVQLADWGEAVPAAQIGEVLDHATRLPSTGVMVFNWGRLHPQWDKVEALGRFFRALRP